MPDEWAGREPEAASPYYPYRKVIPANTMAGAEQLPYVLTKYIMDLPLPGYTPPGDNRFPRARLKKLLYWDGALPLEQPLPTTQQMKSIQFDPYHPGTEPDPAPRGNGPAVYYAVPGFAGRIGFISAIHGKFCDSCNRVRLTSTGFLKQCLCYEDGADLRAIVRSGEETGRRRLLTEAIRSAASNKPESHSFDRPELITEKHRMSGIGG